MRIRGDQHVRGAAARQIGFQRRCIDRVIENQKNSLALVTHPFDYCRDGRFFLLVCADPAQPYAEADEIDTQSGLRLRPNPPRRTVVAAMALPRASSCPLPASRAAP